METAAEVQEVRIDFTQYLYPHGRQKQVYVVLPDEDGALAEAVAWIQSVGRRFEAEVLENTQEVSFTVHNPQEEVDEFCEISENGPPVLDAVRRLVLRAAEALKTAN